jgi:hypothetical protein
MRLGCDLDQVQTSPPGLIQRIAGGHHPDLVAVRTDDPYLVAADPLIQPMLWLWRWLSKQTLADRHLLAACSGSIDDTAVVPQARRN